MKKIIFVIVAFFCCSFCSGQNLIILEQLGGTDTQIPTVVIKTGKLKQKIFKDDSYSLYSHIIIDVTVNEYQRFKKILLNSSSIQKSEPSSIKFGTYSIEERRANKTIYSYVPSDVSLIFFIGLLNKLKKENIDSKFNNALQKIIKRLDYLK